MTASRATALLAAAGVIAALSSAPPSEAYVLGGRAWPRDTITYHVDAAGYAAPVRRAARAWNRAGVGIRFERSSRYDADVVVSYGGRRCEGAAYVGFRRWRANTVTLGRGCSSGLITLTAVHELGHVLGLDHENRRCARMNPGFRATGTPNRCARRTLAWWLDHPLTADDLRGARAMY